ncbi:MAG: hypothetical protein DMG76_22985 [Acidobacteria bacterium]|nr:MAG: hypothetical protein DMG76_22985 [Acidobacteriota bacterium]
MADDFLEDFWPEGVIHEDAKRLSGTGWDVVDDEPQGSTLCRMPGISSYPFATLLHKAARTIRDPAASVVALVESDS